MSETPGGAGAPTRCDLLIVAALLLLITAVAWAFTIDQANRMDAMETAMWRDMNMVMNGREPSWTSADALLLFVMWSAMMTPGASPMVAAFATINHRRRERCSRRRIIFPPRCSSPLGSTS